MGMGMGSGPDDDRSTGATVDAAAAAAAAGTVAMVSVEPQGESSKALEPDEELGADTAAPVATTAVDGRWTGGTVGTVACASGAGACVVTVVMVNNRRGSRGAVVVVVAAAAPSFDMVAVLGDKGTDAEIVGVSMGGGAETVMGARCACGNKRQRQRM